MSGLSKDESLVRRLCDLESGLTGWELDFVEAVAEQVLEEGRKLTDGQREKAEQILEERE